jgi:hypothetical protein
MKRLFALLAVMVPLSIAAPASAASPSLSGWWPLNEGSGTIAHDLSGHGNAGSVSGTSPWTSGYFGPALSANGSTTRVDVADSPSLEPASSITVTAWVKANGPEGQFQYIVSKGAASCQAASYGLYSADNGGLAFYVSQNAGLSYSVSPNVGPAVWDGTWHFVVGTYDGKAVHLYVDGAQVGTGTPGSGAIGYGMPNGNDLFIGHYDGCAAHDFVGTIDEPTVWSGALSASQVTLSYRVMVGLHGLVSRLPAFPS